MSNLLALTGMVLSAIPIGDYDKRVVILTKERGKITAFAKGARRQNSSLLAAVNPFVFGTFSFYVGRTSYTLVRAEVRNYFQTLVQDFEGVYYGTYFMEFADYYARENNDDAELLKLLYISLRALTNPSLNQELVRYTYELKAMMQNGEYPNVFYCQECRKSEHLSVFVPSRDGLLCADCIGEDKQNLSLREATVYTLQYVISTPLDKLYTFTVSPEVLREFKAVVGCIRRKYIEKEFKSLKILESILNY